MPRARNLRPRWPLSPQRRNRPGDRQDPSRVSRPHGDRRRSPPLGTTSSAFRSACCCRTSCGDMEFWSLPVTGATAWVDPRTRPRPHLTTWPQVRSGALRDLQHSAGGSGPQSADLPRSVPRVRLHRNSTVTGTGDRAAWRASCSPAVPGPAGILFCKANIVAWARTSPTWAGSPHRPARFDKALRSARHWASRVPTSGPPVGSRAGADG